MTSFQDTSLIVARIRSSRSQTPKDDKSVNSQGVPMPANLREDLILELSLALKYSNLKVLPFSTYSSPSFAQTQLSGKHRQGSWERTTPWYRLIKQKKQKAQSNCSFFRQKNAQTIDRIYSEWFAKSLTKREDIDLDLAGETLVGSFSNLWTCILTKTISCNFGCLGLSRCSCLLDN